MRRVAAVIVVLTVASGLLGMSGPATAQKAAGGPAFDTKAPEAILVDYDTGTVLFEKAADERVPPASMAKLMTAEYVFHELTDGAISLDSLFPISEHAWRTGGAPSGGSAMYAEIHSDVAVRDLLRGLLVQSGNDAAIALAEGVAGSEPAFAERLNERAREIGLTGSTFVNASGLNAPDQLVTVRDLATLARHIIATYPAYYPIFSEPEFTWNKIRQTNRNPLLGDVAGVDGLKTGFIKESGYGITSSAVRDGRRLILAIAGLKSEVDREAEAKKLFEWGYRSFVAVTAFDADEVVGEAAVYGGEAGRVALKAKQPIRVLVARRVAGEALKARIVYEGPLVAPVDQGAAVGSLKILDGERLVQETPLYTAEAVPQGPLHKRALSALGELLLGWL